MGFWADRFGVHAGRLTLTPGFLFVLGAALWMDEGRLLLFSVSSAALHELGHLAACGLLGVPVWRIRLTCCGGELRPARHLTGWEECITAFAGPLVNLFLAALSVPKAGEEDWALFAGVNLILGFFNLLPMLPLDGGRIIHGLLSIRWGSERAGEALGVFSRVLLALCFLPAAWLCVMGNPSLMVVVVGLALWS